MKLHKEVFMNSQKVNEFDYEGEWAEAELVNLLFSKIKKRYKIDLHTDYIDKTIKAKMSFTHEATRSKYVYDYVFTELNEYIDLR